MYDDKADELVERNLKRINNLDSSFSILTKSLTIEYEPSASGITDLRDCSMSLGTQHQHIAKNTAMSEEVLFSFVFYHEMGHQLLPWIRVQQEKRTKLMLDYFSQDKDLRGSPEYFLEIKGIDFFHDKRLQKFSNTLAEGFDNHSNETNMLLSKFSQKIEAIYHEQFADSFALFMLKKQFPKDFDRFASFLIEGRKQDENFYRDYHDNVMDSEHTLGFVHCLQNMNQEYLLKSKNIHNFSDFEKTIFPLIDKHTASEIKTAMDSQKLGVYFPKELQSPSIESVENSIKNIRLNYLSSNKKELKNKI